MPDIFVIIVAILLSLTTGGLVIYLLVHKRNNNSNQLSQVPHPIVEQPKNFDVSQDPMILEAKSKAKEIVLEAKDAALKIKTEAETSIRSIREQEGALEKDMLMRKSQLESREREIESKFKTLKQAKEAIDKKQEEVDGMYKNQKEQLEKVATLTRDEARKLLLDKFEKELIEERDLVAEGVKK